MKFNLEFKILTLTTKNMKYYTRYLNLFTYIAFVA